jgi:sec-independent protein translocase protein TatB
MIEISLGKMVLLALIALIVLGPEKLPGAARTAGALLRRVRSGWDNVRAEVERELEIEEIKRTARDAAARAEAVQNELKEAAHQAREPFAAAAAMIKPEPSVEVTATTTVAHEPPPNVQAELPLDEPSAIPASPKESHHGGA